MAARKTATKRSTARARPAARRTRSAKKPARRAPARRATARKAPVRKPPARKRPSAPRSERVFIAEEPPEQATPEEAPPVSPLQPGFAPECLMCPFGLFFFAVRSTRPEVMDHLMKAGFELFTALRSVMDQYADRWEQAKQLERIPIA